MTYSTSLTQLSRVPCSLAIITLDWCSLTYGVAPCTATGASGSECYNTFPTCQARLAFTRTTKDYKLTSHEAPLPFSTGERPYIKKITYLPTEIKDTITVKGRVTMEMVDEPDTDIGIDPYVATRASVQGTFWKKMLARNPNFKSRPVKIYDGFIGMSEAEFLSDGKLFTGIIDNITLGKGTVKIESVDILKALDLVEIPKKLDIKLASDIDGTQTSITLVSDVITSMDSPTGYIRVDDEIIYYAAIDTVTKIISGCVRAQFGTIADIHSQNTKVQVVKYYAEDNPFDLMLQVLDDGGISTADIDMTAFTTEKAFVNDLNILAVISEPTKASVLYYELVDLMGCKTWVSESLKITIARNLPNHPTRTYTDLTDNIDILDDSGLVDLNQKSLITRCLVYWDIDPIAPEDENSSYNRMTMALDVDAEGVNEYDQIAEKKIMSRWLSADIIASEEAINDGVNALVARQLWQFRDSQPIISLDLEIKNNALLTGQFVKISTDELQDMAGNDLSSVAFQVVRRERKENILSMKLLRLTTKKICYFAPADAPDYSVATELEKEKYGYFAGDDGKMSDLTDGYVFF